MRGWTLLGIFCFGRFESGGSELAVIKKKITTEGTEDTEMELVGEPVAAVGDPPA